MSPIDSARQELQNEYHIMGFCPSLSPSLKDQSSNLQSYEKWYIRKDHEKWSIFCFYGMFWTVVVFEKFAFEVGDFWNLCITTKTWTIVQATHEQDDQEWDDNCACNSLHHPVIVYVEFSLRSCFRCNTQIFQKSSTSNAILTKTTTIQNMP